MKKSISFILVCVSSMLLTATAAKAQSFGVELHNTQMPASGGMAGTSIARPQDPLSAINGNPSTLAQMKGTQFTFGGSLIDAEIDITQTAAWPPIVPIVTPFTAESQYPPSVLANIGVTQDLSALGLPATVGLGLISNAGAGVDLAAVPGSNGTASSLLVLELVGGVGMELSERLSAGASFQLGTGFLDAPFVGIGKNTPGYGVRGSFGVDYEVNDATTVAAYYQTKQNFTFDDAILLSLAGGAFTPALDVKMDLPRNVGMGVANNSLMDGRLLLAVDVLWKNWNDTDLFQAIYDDQWVVQFGTQYTAQNYKLRLGYAWAENPVQTPPSVSIGGVTEPGGIVAASYVQSQLAVINQHRLSGGISFPDVLPGVDLDLSAGGMLADSQTLSATTIDIESYWVSFGFTWRYGGCGQGSQGCR
jgi:long-chain fatty acid transport protein